MRTDSIPMESTVDAYAALAAAVELQRAATKSMTILRELIRDECGHPLVIQGREHWVPRRVCLSCGSAEVGSAEDFHLLAKPGRVVVTTSEEMPKLDDPNIKVTFFAWCKEGHFEQTRSLTYGWCEDHIPSSVQERRRRNDAREAYYNSAG